MEHPQSGSAATSADPIPEAAVMQAIVQDAYGGADQLRLTEIAAPAVGVDDVLIACGGAFADHSTARVETLAAKPARLTFEEAAALPTSGCTALQALRATGQIAAGERVLIIGASGGVGIWHPHRGRAKGKLVILLLAVGVVCWLATVAGDATHGILMVPVGVEATQRAQRSCG